MPGIVGLVTGMPRQRADAEVRRMTAALRHGSADTTGVWSDAAQGVYLGWSGRDDSGRPACDARSGLVLLFAGEEYGDHAAASREGAGDEPVHPHAPLARLAATDPAFPRGLNGRFHGVVVDRARGTVLVFNDRFGIHRLYYHQTNDAFYFAAEAKAILAVRPELRAIDTRGLGELVACGCTLENRTIFKDLRVLPPASAWAFRNGALDAPATYFAPREWEEQPILDAQAYYAQLRDVFARSLPRYFGGPRRIAMSLTGGLDTRMIMAWHRPAAGSLPCYSFGGMFRDCEDVTLARQVARACDQPHQVIEIGADFLGRFSEYAERAVYLTDGCASVSHAADLYGNERAAQIAPVRMTGNYGGEVLRRVRAFKPTRPAPGLFRPELLEAVRTAAGTYETLLDCHPLSFALFRQTPWHHYGLLALEQTQVSLRSPYLDNEFVRTVFQAPASVLASNDLCWTLIGDGDPRLRRIRTDRGFGGDAGPLRSAVTRRVLDFTFKAEYAYDYGMPQRVAAVDRRLSALHLERLFLGRHKFKHYRVWYRDQLSAYVREMLLDRRTRARPYVDGRTLEGMVERHLRGDRNYTAEIHQVLTLELIHRLFVDARQPDAPVDEPEAATIGVGSGALAP